jgi:hypothetical protein
MYLYNVTINVEDDIHDDWMDWMKAIHIPEVMATGCFVANRMLKVLSEVENNGTTYSMQYYFSRMEDYTRYKEKFAPALQKTSILRYGQKFVAFRTLLEIVE